MSQSSDAANLRHDGRADDDVLPAQAESSESRPTHPAPESEMELDEIIAELDHEYDGTLPEQALRAAQGRRAEITPLLIDQLHRTAQKADAGEFPSGNGHIYALYLLAEFQAKEALPAIQEVVSFPEDALDELFGDTITEDLSRILAALAVDQPAMIDAMIANQSLNEYVRWAAASVYLLWLRDGRITRDAAVERLREHLRKAIELGDAQIAGPLVCELEGYSACEAMEEIKEAFGKGLIEADLVDLKFIERAIAKGEPRLRESLQNCRPTGIADTVEELRRWACFNEVDYGGYEDDELSSDRFHPLDLAPEFDGDAPVAPEIDDFWQSATVRNVAPRVRRNDPCPCGSGKKFKKCCARSEANASS